MEAIRNYPYGNDEIFTLADNMRDEYREELFAFAEELSGGLRGYAEDGKISFEEADHLIDQLLTLENPYTCPHGRPTLITITEQELEKKFKRIV